MTDGDQHETTHTTDEEKVELKEAGKERYFDGEYAEAIELYEQALGLDPEYGDAYFHRGNGHQASGNLEQAIHDYNKAMELGVKPLRSIRNRGNAYKRLGEYEQAIEDYNEAIELAPESEHAYSNRGTAYYDSGEYEKAIDDYTKALELNPDYVPAYLNRTEIRLALDRPEKALEDARAALDASEDVDMVALGLLFVIVCKLLVGEDVSEDEKRYKDVCTKEFTFFRWSFDNVESWLKSAELDSETETKIRELLDLLQEHEEG